MILLKLGNCYHSYIPGILFEASGAFCYHPKTRARPTNLSCYFNVFVGFFYHVTYETP